MISFITLYKREVNRFLGIPVQTILGPVSTAVLYQIIFGYQFSSITSTHSYALFLMPGLVMMQILLNAFGNGSSSLILSKYTGNIVYVLMAPMSEFTIFNAYLLAAIVRGLVVGLAVFLAIVGFTGLDLFSISLYHLLLILYYTFIGSCITGAMGLIAGIICNKFDQISGFQSFIFMPLIYLGGIFFNIEHFPPFLKYLTYVDPFLYVVDGLRFAFLGSSSIPVHVSFVVSIFFALLVYSIGLGLLKKGYNIKN